MIDEQQPDELRPRVLALVGLGVVAITLVLVWIAWRFVSAPAPAVRAPTQPSMLEHELFSRASGEGDVAATGARRLQEYGWVDRSAHLVRIPIDRAIDAVVADPGLIGPRTPQAPTP